LWPQAIKGFLKNPILGSGYSTLVKGNVDEFTYAESTDNDYLRMLGETGLFGTLSFLAIIFFLVKYALALYHGTFTLPDLVGVGALAATVAILVTASYIDVFESSKVAYVFWMMMALVAYLYDHEQTHR
jgi:O-antigen ligase